MHHYALGKQAPQKIHFFSNKPPPPPKKKNAGYRPVTAAWLMSVEASYNNVSIIEA